MKTRKNQIAWMRSLILATPSENLFDGLDCFGAVAANLRAAGSGPDGFHLYKGFRTWVDAAEHFLRGCGLWAFPIYTEEHENLLRSWGYNPTPRMVENFWTVSAGLLIEVLRGAGYEF